MKRKFEAKINQTTARYETKITALKNSLREALEIK